MSMNSVVVNLIVLNVIMYAVKMYAAGSMFLDLDLLLGLHHPYSPEFSWYQYITGIFMHGSFSHLLFNMLGLYIFGSMLERIWDARRFLLFYLVAGIGSSLIYQIWQSVAAYNYLQQFGDGLTLLMQNPPNSYLIGASGAVYGLLMGAALLFPNTEMYLFFFPGLPIKLKWMAIFYGGAELLRAYQDNPGDNIAHFAHIGGMIFGFILIKIFNNDRSRFY